MDIRFLTREQADAAAAGINGLFAKRGHVQPVVKVYPFTINGVTFYNVVEILTEFPV